MSSVRVGEPGEFWSERLLSCEIEIHVPTTLQYQPVVVSAIDGNDVCRYTVTCQEGNERRSLGTTHLQQAPVPV